MGWKIEFVVAKVPFQTINLIMTALLVALTLAHLHIRIQSSAFILMKNVYKIKIQQPQSRHRTIENVCSLSHSHTL